MTVLLASPAFLSRCAAEIAAIAAIEGPRGLLELVALPDGEGDARVSPDDLARVTAGYASPDLNDSPARGLARRMFGSVRRAPNLEWFHVSHVGLDDPLYEELMGKGVIVSNAAGATAEPIALTLLAALLSLARGLPRWADAQRRHEWSQLPAAEWRPDLRGQTLVLVGLGEIGGRLAAMLRPLGLHVIGVRRSPAGAAEHVDEWAAPERLGEMLPRADWVVLAVPLTADTRGMLDAAALARLPRGAHVLNVGRGQLLDEDALIEALRSGHLGGAYLDVFNEEPLPAESPLWDLPNVILSPHSAGHAQGNEARANAIFLEELERWQRGQEPARRVTER